MSIPTTFIPTKVYPTSDPDTFYAGYKDYSLPGPDYPRFLWRKPVPVSYGSGYLVNAPAGLSIGATSIPFDTGTNRIWAGNSFKFQGDSNVYRVTAAPNAVAGTATIAAPGLLAAIANNTPIAVLLNYQVNSVTPLAIGTVKVPIDSITTGGGILDGNLVQFAGDTNWYEAACGNQWTPGFIYLVAPGLQTVVADNTPISIKNREPRTIDQLMAGLTVRQTFLEDFDDVDTAIVDGGFDGNFIHSVRPEAAQFSSPARAGTGGAPLVNKSGQNAAGNRDVATNGKLIIQGPDPSTVRLVAQRDANGNFYSSHMQTAYRTGPYDFQGFCQQFGRFNIRVRFHPLTPGDTTNNNRSWPAFWFLSKVEYDGSGRGRTECDCFEVYCTNDSEAHTPHSSLFIHTPAFPAPGQSTDIVGSGARDQLYNGILNMGQYPQYYPNSNMCDGQYHEFDMVWMPTIRDGDGNIISPAEIVMLYEGTEYCSKFIGNVHEWQQAMYILVSHQLVGPLSTSTTSPMFMDVDWVKAWQASEWEDAAPDFQTVPTVEAPPVQMSLDVLKVEALLGQDWGNLALFPGDHPWKAGVNPSARPMSPAKVVYTLPPLPADNTVLGVVTPSNIALEDLSSATYIEDAPTKGSPILAYDPATGVLSVPVGSRLNQTTVVQHTGKLYFNSRGRITTTFTKLIGRATNAWLPSDMGPTLKCWYDSQDTSGATNALTVLSGNNLSQWRDKSSWLNHLNAVDSYDPAVYPMDGNHVREPKWVRSSALNGKAVIGSGTSNGGSAFTRLNFSKGSPIPKHIQETDIIVGTTTLSFALDRITYPFTGYNGAVPHMLMIMWKVGQVRALVNGVDLTCTADMSGLGLGGGTPHGAIFAVLKGSSNGPNPGGRLFYTSVQGPGHVDAIFNTTESGSRAYDGLMGDFLAVLSADATVPCSDHLRQIIEGWAAWKYTVPGVGTDLVAALQSGHPFKARAPIYTD